MKTLRKTPVPGKKNLTETNQEAFQIALVDAHSAVLGASALVLAWPYEVPSWLPDLLLATANKFSTSRAPVSTTVKDLLAQFRKTHQGQLPEKTLSALSVSNQQLLADTWSEDQKKFSPEQLQDLNDLVIGTSYYA
jgi:proteasome activator subunit 4